MSEHPSESYDFRGDDREKHAESASELSKASDTNLAVALDLAAAGILIFPTHISFNESDRNWKKKPCISNWQTSATTDAHQIRQWWCTYPDAVPGIELRRCGLVVIDCDRHEGGQDGVTALVKLAEQHGDLPRGPMVRTAGGGIHFYYQQPLGETPIGNSSGSLPPGIDIRAEGGWAVAPGSVRADGAVYAPVEESPELAKSFRDGSIPYLPPWLIRLIREPRSKADDSQKRREQAYASKALEKCTDEVKQAVPGKRNNTLNNVSYRLGRMIGSGWIDRLLVESRLFDASIGCGLVNDDGESSVRGTIKSGLESGFQNPHPHLSDAKNDESSKSNGYQPWWDGDPISRPPFLVRDLVPQGSVGLLVGESQAGKSFLAVYLAACLARGTQFFGKKVQSGGTVYVAAEAANLSN